MCERANLIFWLKICNHDIISINSMRNLTLTCKNFLNILRKKIDYYKTIRAKWEPILARKILPYLVYKSNPIKYTNSTTKVIPIYDMIVNNTLGIRPLDVPGGLFTELELSTMQYALANVLFRMRTKKPFAVCVSLYGFTIIEKYIDLDDIIDTGELTIDDRTNYQKLYGPDEFLYPGRYLVNLDLPLLFNPVLVNAPFVDFTDVYINILFYVPVEQCTGATVGRLTYSVNWFIDYFTHAIVKFRYVNKQSYDWNDYRVAYDGNIDQYVNYISLTQRRNDISLTQWHNKATYYLKYSS